MTEAQGGGEWSTELTRLSEHSTYRVLEDEMNIAKEVPTWHGQRATPRSVITNATSAPTGAHDPLSTPETTSATSTLPTEGADPRHIGWCAGGRRGATPDGACRVCGYVGRVSRHDVVPHHRDRRTTPPKDPS